jgi:hypothetical protein
MWLLLRLKLTELIGAYFRRDVPMVLRDARDL